MSRCRVLSVLGASAAVGGLCLAFIPLQQAKPATKPATKPAAAAAKADDASSGTYRVDPVHSSVVFRVKHMDLAWFHGRFNEVTGSFTWDAAQPGKSSVELVIPVASVDTANEKRDQHLKSPDFFSEAEFPEVRFKSDKVTQGKDGMLEVSGTLDMHGVSKPVSAQVELTGASAGDGRRPAMIGFEAVFTIKRSDFGVGDAGGLGDEVRITVSVEAGKQG